MVLIVLALETRPVWVVIPVAAVTYAVALRLVLGPARRLVAIPS
jgi:hypothetical protein